MSETLTVADQTLAKDRQPAERDHCNNGGCTRPIYRGKECFRCWAGTKWTSIWQRIQNKNGHNPSYESVLLEVGRSELINWILENPPPKGMERPSIDRIDNNKGYSLSNIRWLEHRINSRHCQRDAPKGLKICSGCGLTKPLSHFNKNRSRPDGVQSRCQPCSRNYERQWRLSRKSH